MFRVTCSQLNAPPFLMSGHCRCISFAASVALKGRLFPLPVCTAEQTVTNLRVTLEGDKQSCVSPLSSIVTAANIGEIAPHH
jgi:hypothetical protein